MTQALRCDAKGCETVGVEPFTGWYAVQVLGPIRLIGEPEELHACSMRCVGLIAFDRAGEPILEDEGPVA